MASSVRSGQDTPSGTPSGTPPRRWVAVPRLQRARRRRARRKRTLVLKVGLCATGTFLALWIVFSSIRFHGRLSSVHREREGRMGLRRNPRLPEIDRDGANAGGMTTTRGEESRGDGGPSSWIPDIANIRTVQEYLLAATGRPSPPLTAYVEPPLPLYDNSSSAPAPRLRLRTHSPDALRKFEYPEVRTCSDLPGGWPVGYPPDLHSLYDTARSRTEARLQYAERFSPVDADPFLPSIHDAFPSGDGSHVNFVAHNRRLCNTDAKRFTPEMDNLEAQVTLMQPVPLRRVGEEEARRLAPELWSPDDDGGSDRDAPGSVGSNEAPPVRYRLATREEADLDALETRFVCRFHTLEYVTKGGADGAKSSPAAAIRKVVLGETFSTYPYNYEAANLRKQNSKPMLAPPGHRSMKEQIWNTVLHFRCPVPAGLREAVRSGSAVVDDSAGLFVDVVPVRTHPRREREGYVPGGNISLFDPAAEWGEANVLPRLEASGRWANVPVCRPPGLDEAGSSRSEEEPSLATAAAAAAGKGTAAGLAPDEPRRPRPKNEEGQAEKGRHFLVGCTWASAAFSTRGVNAGVDTSASDRLLEWLTYHLYVAGFDHMYVYDNSGAGGGGSDNVTSLESIVDVFPPSRVTRIAWPHRICNNNRPANPNPGERSSQYAAEASCRVRYGGTTEWMAAFDADEYLIPNGRWGNLTQWLREGKINERTGVLSFFSARASPNAEFLEPYRHDGGKCGGRGGAGTEATCLAKRANATFLETYNCDAEQLPKPDWAWRAKKQIFRPSYVLSHHVHYATVTSRVNTHPFETSPRFKQTAPYERRVDEVREAFMLHAKTRPPADTAGWEGRCRGGGRQQSSGDAKTCPVGIPWPMDGSGDSIKVRGDGMRYNCYRHTRIQKIVPRLQGAMAPFLEQCAQYKNRKPSR